MTCTGEWANGCMPRGWKIFGRLCWLGEQGMWKMIGFQCNYTHTHFGSMEGAEKNSLLNSAVVTCVHFYWKINVRSSVFYFNDSDRLFLVHHNCICINHIFSQRNDGWCALRDWQYRFGAKCACVRTMESLDIYRSLYDIPLYWLQPLPLRLAGSVLSSD